MIQFTPEFTPDQYDIPPEIGQFIADTVDGAAPLDKLKVAVAMTEGYLGRTTSIDIPEQFVDATEFIRRAGRVAVIPANEYEIIGA